MGSTEALKGWAACRDPVPLVNQGGKKLSANSYALAA